MGMNRESNIQGFCRHFNGQGPFADEVGRMRSHDGHTQNDVGFCINNHDKPIVSLVVSARPIAAKGILPTLMGPARERLLPRVPLLRFQGL